MERVFRMNILVDHHHGALLRSMYYLFKKRLGYNVFVPHGYDWRTEELLYSGYPSEQTAKQMLDHWIYHPQNPEMFEKCTLSKFKDVEFDFIVVSLYENYQIFEKIIKKYNKKTKLIFQVGNNIDSKLVDGMSVKNLLSSAYPTYSQAKVPNKIFYHQEFSLDYFNKLKCKNTKSVGCFKNIMEEDVDLFLKLEKKMPDWEFKAYGAQNRDGLINDNESDMSNAMKTFGFIFHVKKDEGYGHVIHNAFALGKPTIVNGKGSFVNWDNEFIQATSHKLFNKNTAIDSNQPIDLIVHRLLEMEKNYDFFHEETYKTFTSLVDFAKEAESIKIFLEKSL